MSGEQGWRLDPFGIHEWRYVSVGVPTNLVSDRGVASYDDPPRMTTPLRFREPTGRFELTGTIRGPQRSPEVPSPWPAVRLPHGHPGTNLPGRHRRLWAAKVAIAVLIAIGAADGVALSLGGSLGPPKPVSTIPNASKPASAIPNAPITGFGGYHVLGPVTELSAEWSVPQITGGPSVAHAATWIGVQDPHGGFFQIGTTEDEWFGAPIYSGFWSDPDVGFHAQFMLSVTPGDEISVRLTEGTNGWSGTVEDATSDKTASVPAFVHYGAGSAMQFSEWVQEDPGLADGAGDEPYPETTQVTFTDLQVNDEAPAMTLNDATALDSPNGVVLVPSAVQSDSFSMEQGTATQGQYLRDTSGFDSALNQFLNPQVRGGGATAANGRALVSAIATFDSRLSTQEWPPDIRADVMKLLGHDRTLLTDLQSWQAAGESKSALAPFLADAGLNGQFSNPIRLKLGLPTV
jgi:hypothetical protein